MLFAKSVSGCFGRGGNLTPQVGKVVTSSMGGLEIVIGRRNLWVAFTSY